MFGTSHRSRHGTRGPGSRSLARRPKLRRALALAALASVALAGPASASTYDAGAWSDEGTESGICGAYELHWREWGTWEIQDATSATDYQFFYFSNQWNAATTVTNPATGRFFTERVTGEYFERRARSLGDDIFAFNTMDRGTYTVAREDGKVAYRDKGLVLLKWQFDTQGDSQPGGWVVDGYPVELASTWDSRFDFCALAERLIG